MMKRITFFAAALLFSLPLAHALEFGTALASGKRVTICRVEPAKERLELFVRDDAGRPLKSFDGVNTWLRPRGRTLLFAMNAGMYHGDLSPVGLAIADGKQIAPVNLAEGEGNFFLKPNGVFLVLEKGARVVASEQVVSLKHPALADKPFLATQSGPLLVLDNRIHPAFRPDSVSRLHRNGVGVTAAGAVFFALSEEPVNFYEFATFFRDVLRCPNALFFDGTVSSLYAPALKRNDKKIDLGPIIGITGPADAAAPSPRD